MERLLDALQENDQLKWQLSQFQIDQAHVVLEYQKLLREHDTCKLVHSQLREAQHQLQ